MRLFLKIFLACLTAILVTIGILTLLGVSIFNAAINEEKPEVKSKTVLVIDLTKQVMEQKKDAGFDFPEGKSPEVLGFFDLVRSIEKAAKDSLVKGIYLQTRGNTMGFATSNELRNALLTFKKTGKFIVAASDNISQRAYEVANVANEIYCHPGGMLDWKGYSMQLAFFKGALDKLEVKPEIFYAGQYKSATEPFRFTQMSEPNRRQLTEFLEDLYQRFLMNTAEQRKMDTQTLRKLTVNYEMAHWPQHQKTGLLTGFKYDDEIKDEIRKKLKIKADDTINFMAIGQYLKTVELNELDAADKIAIIYMQGEIVDGNGDAGQIGVEKYRNLLRKVRKDKNVKAVVLRINSPGGSASASEGIWREIILLKKEKPVVVSMGDYAASGGYYIACTADSIFAQPSTLTGSIGVFSMYFNAQGLLNNKLGITFDGVKTAPFADYGNAMRPMTKQEKSITQLGVDSIYQKFKTRVAQGRNLAEVFVDSIAQGRIWSGSKAITLKLVDKIGGLQDALDCAGRMAKIKDYQIREYPFVETFWKQIMGKSEEEGQTNLKFFALKEQIGAEQFEIFEQIKQVKNWSGIPQMRLPFFTSFK